MPSALLPQQRGGGRSARCDADHPRAISPWLSGSEVAAADDSMAWGSDLASQWWMAALEVCKGDMAAAAPSRFSEFDAGE